MRHPERQTPLRVLHCPWNIAGQPAALAAAERALGAESYCFVLLETSPGFPADACLMQSENTMKNAEIARYRLLWHALKWADVVHFSFGQSCLGPYTCPDWPSFGKTSLRDWLWGLYARLIWMQDLPLLRLARKAIFVTWQGDDARQGDRSRELFDISIAKEVDDGYYPAGSDAWKRRAIGRFSRFCHGQYALNPDLLHVLPAGTGFLPYASFDVDAVPCRPPDPEGRGPLRIVHAPSNRGAKGTKYVLAALERMRAADVAFEFELIEGLPREAALARYATADIVVDQLLAGWYGGLAVEAMALGKVVVSYLRQADFAFVPGEMLSALPIVDATSATIEAVLRNLVEMPRHRLASIGRSGRTFVETWHRPASVAERTIADYRHALAKLRGVRKSPR